MSYPSTNGRQMVKRLPCSGADSTSMRPPWAVTMRCAMARPRPVPPGFFEMNGWKIRRCSSGEMPGPVSATLINTSPLRRPTFRVRWPLTLHGLHPVAGDVPEHLRQLVSIEGELGNRRVDPHVHLHAAASVAFLLEERGHMFDNLADITRSAV